MHLPPSSPLIFMNELFPSLDIINKIVKENVGFTMAITEASRKNKYDANDRRVLSSVVGCALRHYLVLNARYESICNGNKEHATAFALAVSNLLFSKVVEYNDTINFLKETTSDQELVNREIELIDKFLNGEALIPSELDPNCLEFLSFRYNTPLWIVKMWRKHYGYKVLRKLLIAHSKHFSNYARLNKEYIDEERFLNENKNFTKYESFPNFYHFDERNGIKKTNAFLAKQIYVYSIPFDEIIEKSEADSFRGIAVYSDNPNAFLCGLAANLTSYVELDYLIGQQQTYFEVKNQKIHYNLKNVHLYEGQPSSLITCISKKVHSFYVLPISSNFFLLRNTPDYFIHFNQNSLDEILLKQSDALEEASKFIEDDGFLTYVVPTLSEKETHGIINKFLENHKDFVLIEDKIIFPFSEYDTTEYYAILKKVVSND